MAFIEGNVSGCNQRMGYRGAGPSTRARSACAGGKAWDSPAGKEGVRSFQARALAPSAACLRPMMAGGHGMAFSCSAPSGVYASASSG